MFQAIRRQLTQWQGAQLSHPQRRRIRRWTGLFLFEFVVVLFGVLAAQRLQEAGVQARARSDAAAAVERAEHETASFRATSEYWLRAGPCLAGQMDVLMRAAATGEDLPGEFPRPRMPLSSFTPWTEGTSIAARSAFGEGLVSDYAGLQVMAAKMAEDSHDLAGEWALLSLLDPRFGPVAREDRLNARVAAGRIKGRLASLRVTARNAVAAAERRKVATDPARRSLLTLPAGCETMTP